jgi:hypothetical protein
MPLFGEESVSQTPPTEKQGIASTEGAAPPFLDREAIERLAASAAMLGHSLDEAEERLNNYYEILETHTRQKVSGDVTYLTDQRNSVARDLSAATFARQRAQRIAAETEEKLQQGKAALCKQSAALTREVYFVRQERLRNIESDQKKQQEMVADYKGRSIDRLKSEFYLRNAYKAAALEARKQEWSLNRGEFENRANELEKEKEVVEEQLKKIEPQTEALRKIGITRNVSGFLFWSGSVAVAAAATLLAEFVAKHDKTDSTIDKVISHLRSLVTGGKATADGWSIFRGMLPLVLLILSIIVTALAVTWLLSPLQRGFHDKRRGKQKSRPVNVPWPFSLVHRDIGATIDQLTLRSILRNVPALVIIPISLLAVIALTPPNVQLHSTSTSVAIAFILSFHAISVLYATTVLGPRLKAALEQTEAAKPQWRRAGALILAITGLLAIGAVLLLGLAPTSKDSIGWPLIPFCLFLVIGGYALPLSMVFRGIFKDLDFLRDRRQWFRTRIADLKAQPTADDVDDADEDVIEDNVAQWRSRTAALDQQHYLEMCRLYHDEWPLGFNLDDFATMPGGAREDFDAHVLRRMEHPEPLMYFRSVPQPLVLRFTDAYVRRLQTTQEIVTLEAQKQKNDETLAEIEKRIESLQASMQAYEVKLNLANRQHLDEVAALKHRQINDALLLHEAWAISHRGATGTSYGPRIVPAAA